MIQAFRGDSGVSTDLSGPVASAQGVKQSICRWPGCRRSAKARDFIRLEGQRPSSGRQAGLYLSKKTFFSRTGCFARRCI